MVEFNTAIKTQYQQERQQADHDHQFPTAGAMTNHILSNHVILTNKLRQAAWFSKGMVAVQLAMQFQATNQENNDWIEAIASQLLDEGEIPANQTVEYQEWSMLVEAGENKYLSPTEQLAMLVQDFNTDNLFVDRAIKLAQQENRLAMVQLLIKLRGWNQRQIRIYQAMNGNSARDGLDEEDED